MSRWMWTTLAVLPSLVLGFLVGGAAKAPHRERANVTPDQPQPPPAITPATPTPAFGSETIPLRDAAIGKLTDANWDQEAARAVVGFHWDWLSELFESDRVGYDRTLIELSQLQDLGEGWVFLREHPEFAGLLGMVARSW